jgi:serine/threonine protein kinase
MEVAVQSLAAGVTLRGGKYRVGEVVGRGGYSFVYAATRSDGRVVAIKELFPPDARRKTFLGLWTRQSVRRTRDWTELTRRARDEFALVVALRHPNIPRVYELFEENRTLYIVMELLHGVTLQDHLALHGKLNEGDALVVGTAVGAALAAAHAKGVVHRDVKPANVMTCDDGRVMLLDFGIARTFRRSDARTQVGTRFYMAPEQVRGARQTAAVDVYGLGATIYHTLTGIPPVAADDRVRGEWLPPPEVVAPHVGPVASEAVMRALSLVPAARPKSVAEFLEELRGVPVEVASQAPAGGPRWSWWKPLALVAALALVALVMWAW